MVLKQNLTQPVADLTRVEAAEALRHLIGLKGKENGGVAQSGSHILTTPSFQSRVSVLPKSARKKM